MSNHNHTTDSAADKMSPDVPFELQKCIMDTEKSMSALHSMLERHDALKKHGIEVKFDMVFPVTEGPDGQPSDDHHGGVHVSYCSGSMMAHVLKQILNANKEFQRLALTMVDREVIMKDMIGDFKQFMDKMKGLSGLGDLEDWLGDDDNDSQKKPWE